MSERDAVTLPATWSVPRGEPLNVAWDLDGDGFFEAAGQDVSFSAVQVDGPKDVPISVRVTDNGGLTWTGYFTHPSGSDGYDK